ncbi:hypothetical protein PybrP1_002264 [[Pythium] brassicae (nom. inval.)]|nr:hypothetical protein PybrP1_002264 [[Pythium] brassicae (nom. inval.)]
MTAGRSAEAKAALQVLTDASLFQSVVQFSGGISYAAHQVEGQLVCSRRWSDKPAPQDVELLQTAIRAGDRRTLEALCVLANTKALGERVHKVLARSLEYALANAPDCALIEWMASIGLFPGTEFCRQGWAENVALGRRGDVEIVQWAMRQRFAMGEEFLAGAAGGGHLELVTFLHRCEKYRFRDKLRAVYEAAAGGHLDVVEYLMENMAGDLSAETNKLLDGAATGGSLAIVGYLHAKGIAGCSAAAMDTAATNGHLDIVTFLHEHALGGCTTKAMDGAATNGHVDIVAFLHANRSEGCTTQAVDGAVENGHVEVALFLRGHRREGCSRKAVLSAVTANDVDKLKLLCEAGGVGAFEGALPLAAELGNLPFVRYLWDVCGPSTCRIPREDPVTSAASRGRLDLLRFFHERDHHFRFSAKAMHQAAVHNHLHVVKFLHEHRTEGCMVDTLFECDTRGHAHVLNFLCTRRPMANPDAAVARAKREQRALLAAMLTRHAGEGGARTTYAYRHV